MAAAQAGGLVGFGPRRGARSTGGHDPFFWVDDPFFRVTETPDTGKLNWLRLEGFLKWCHDSCQYIYMYIHKILLFVGRVVPLVSGAEDSALRQCQGATDLQLFWGHWGSIFEPLPVPQALKPGSIQGKEGNEHKLNHCRWLPLRTFLAPFPGSQWLGSGVFLTLVNCPFGWTAFRFEW